MSGAYRWAWLGASVGIALSVVCIASAADEINLLIIDGQNFHNWQATTPPIAEMLRETGRFRVEVVTTPDKDAPEEAWNEFRPDFSKYGAVLTNYCGQPWPQEVNQAFEDYVRGGGGLVVYHFAVASFPEWEAYNDMIGMGWRKNTFGDSIALNDDGEVVRRAKGEGPGAGHGPQHPFEVMVRDRDHPIMKGMPDKWAHVKDELYHGQRGPAQNMHILATAYSSPEFGGTGLHEPMAWTIPYGKGRVFVNLLGHDVAQTTAPDCASLLCRGAEWVATGAVTIPVMEGIQVPVPNAAP